MTMQETPAPNRLPRLLRENLSLIVIVVIIGAAYLVLRTPESDLQSLAALDEALTGGRPTLLEMYSNT
jgi:hypothetical protein